MSEPTPEPPEPTSAPHSDVTDHLLTLQAIDTERDQLRTRREKLPELTDVASARHGVEEWQTRADSLQTRLTELEQLINDAERENGDSVASKNRLEAQLKTVIAPREAEALMHEIELTQARIDELDLAELSALEEQAGVDDDLTAHLAREEPARQALRDAEHALAEVAAELDREDAALADRAATARATLPDGLLARYDRLRSSQGVAVARLNGKRCEGCHLDLSAAEVDDAKEAAAAAGLTDCPQCGRMLVV